MIIYFILIIYIILLYILTFYNKKNTESRKKIFLICAFIPMTTVMAFRTKDVGVDTNLYCKLFEQYGNMSFYDLIVTGGGDGSTSYLYMIYNKIIYLICNNMYAIVFTNAIIVCFLAARFIYTNCKNNILSSTLLYILMCHYMYYFNATRQGIAILIMANTLQYLNKKELKKYLINLIIATLIHPTAILYIIFLPYLFLKLDKKTIFIVLGITTIAFVGWEFILDIFALFSSHYKIYIGAEVTKQVGGMRKLIYTIIYFVFAIGLGLIMYTQNNKLEDEKKRELILLFIMNYYLVLSGILYIKNWIFIRIEDYFMIYDILIIPVVINHFKKLRVLLNFIIFIMMLLGMYVRLNSGYAGVVPYSTWL